MESTAATSPGEETEIDTIPVYGSLTDFYRDDHSRAMSPEMRYGGRWRLRRWPGNFRVGYVEATGEVYAEHHRADGETGVVFVLGVIPPDAGDQGVCHGSFDRVMADCSEHRTTANGLSQLIQRVRDWRGGNAPDN